MGVWALCATERRKKTCKEKGENACRPSAHKRLSFRHRPKRIFRCRGMQAKPKRWEWTKRGQAAEREICGATWPSQRPSCDHSTLEPGLGHFQPNMGSPHEESPSAPGLEAPSKRRVIQYSFWAQSSALLVKSARNQVRDPPPPSFRDFRVFMPSTLQCSSFVYRIANPKSSRNAVPRTQNQYLPHLLPDRFGTLHTLPVLRNRA